jgi:hypothetical protein
MKKIIFLSIMTLVFSSCKKYEEVSSLTNFDVKIPKSSYKIGEQVNFEIVGGDAQQITFYSGKVGNAYDYRNVKRIDQLNELYLAFDTHNTATANEGFPKVMISSDFDGNFNFANVKAATWKDMSSRFVFGAPAVWQTGWTSSGALNNLYDFVKDAKSFYIAYQYYVPDRTALTGTAPAAGWRTRNNVLTGTTKFGTTQTIASNAAASWNWTLVLKEPLMTSRTVVSGTTILLEPPASTSPYYKQEYEVWAVSKKFDVTEIDLGADKGVGLKQYIDPPVSQYSTSYTAAGTYKVVFVASNTTANDSKQVVKELTITVTP